MSHVCAYLEFRGFPGDSDDKESACNARDLGSIRNSQDRGTATHSSILAWRIPWRDETRELQPIRSQRTGEQGEQHGIVVVVGPVSLPFRPIEGPAPVPAL